MNKILQAREFAIRAHGDQLYAGKPYVYHLDQVVAVLREFDYTGEDIIVAGYLHDVLEDTKIPQPELYDFICFTAFAMVLTVTGFGDTREERTENTIIKLKLFSQAVPLKMADRLANMRFSKENSSKHFNMYKKELKKYSEVFYGPMYEEMKTL